MPPPLATLPTFPDLPHHWKPADGRAVLAAVEASGLTPTEFARATGVDVRRIWRWRERFQTERPRGARSRPARSGPIRLVELVAHAPSPVQPAAQAAELAAPAAELPASLPVADVPVPEPAPVSRAPTEGRTPPPPDALTCPTIDVTTPRGWQLRVPGVLLGDLVRALSC